VAATEHPVVRRRHWVTPLLAVAGVLAAFAALVAVRSTSSPPGEAKPALHGRAALVYDAYYEHCKHYTYDALAYPQHAGSAVEAARLYAGSPRRYQQAAFRGCLAGLEGGDGQITLSVVRAQRDDDH
jgi:hypothetical protein